MRRSCPLPEWWIATHLDGAEATLARGIMMIDDIYNARILELAAAVPAPTTLERSDGSATRHSKLCGSVVRVDVAMDGNAVADVAMQVKACALGQAAASVMYANAVGATTAEIVEARDALRSMLKDGGEAPGGRFADLAFLAPVKDYRARHASTLLAAEALAEAAVAASGRAAA